MIRRAAAEDVPMIAELASALWPHHTAASLIPEYAEAIASEDSAVFLCLTDSTPIGFAQCQLRHDYVEGTSTTPVGYLEGIYISPAHRRQGHARALLSAAESWAASRGCSEFASDCELTNTASEAFREANRIICFTKKL